MNTFASGFLPRLVLALLAFCLAGNAAADWADDVGQVQQLVNRGQYAEAEQFASESLKRGPGGFLFAETGTLTLHYWRGRLRLHLGDTAGAIEDAEALIKANTFLMPPDAGYDLRAMARAVQGDASGALADFEAGLAAARSGFVTGLRTASLLGNRAIARVLLNDLEGAQGDFARALETEQSALAMADFIAAKRDSWSRQRDALAKLQAGDGRGAIELAQAASQVFATVKGPSTTSEFVSAELFLAEIRRREAQTSDLAATGAPGRAVDPVLLALLDMPPRQSSVWGVQSKDAEGGGVLLGNVRAGMPAAEAGLQPGDVLLAINGETVLSERDWLAKRETLPLFTPLNLSVRRDGRRIETMITVQGHVRLTVRPIDTAFVVPGVQQAVADDAPSAVDALDAFNVLERVILDPASGQVAIMGRYDPQFRTGAIPYLDLLKTALAYPTPRLNIKPTAATAQLLQDMRPEITAKLRDFPFNQMVDHVQGHPGLERDRQLMVRELARLYGIAPEEYAGWYNFARLDVQREGYSELFPPAVLRAPIAKAYRTLGHGDVADALILLYQQTPAAAMQALQTLGRGDQAATLAANGGEDTYGAAMVAAFQAIGERTASISKDNIQTLRSYYEAKRMSWQDVIRVYQGVMPYQPKNARFSLMHQAFHRITLSDPAGLLAFPKLQAARSRIEPIDLDPASQLTSIMFEADYAFKSIETQPELFARVPGFILKTEHRVKNPTAGDAKSARIWMEPDTVQMAVAPGRNIIDFGAATMRVRAADATDLIDLSAADADTPDLYTLWKANHLMKNFDAYARIVPAFHKVREAAKVIALAQWLQAEKLAPDLGSVAQTPWRAPDDFPLLSILSQSFRVLPDGKAELTTYLTTEGGVSFKPANKWAVVAPSAQSETRAVDHLALSASLGQQAVKVLRDGDMEQARHLAELSAQAMNGSLSRAQLDKLGIAVPEVQGLPAAPVNVQLQKTLLHRTAQQIDALKRNPQSREAAAAQLEVLDQAYRDVQAEPVRASEYLLKLQVRQAEVPVPVAASSREPAAKETAGGACKVSLLPQETLPGASKAVLAQKLAAARDRLRYIQEALRKLAALNARQRAEMEQLTQELTQAYEAANERAYEFVVGLLTDLPLAKYADLRKVRLAELDRMIESQKALRNGPLSEAARRAIEGDIEQMSQLRGQYETAAASLERLLALYAGANYGKDIVKWEQETRQAADWQRGLEATRLGGKILLDLPWLEDKFLSRKDWFGGNRLWQVVAMGKMAWTASDFFWDIMNQYFAWQPLADQLLRGMKVNTQAMNDLRQKAQATLKEIDCLQRLVQQ
ncbi:MAG: PDZ domain-containing protein [Hylemonella sp.]|nr:PDZ domain-containing protein [Hylemonella sp.]MDP1935716.1 PDZ domain-containing protein [Hylemonella sp.]